MSELHDDLIGKQLGQYTILEEVGRGGMATVYKARQASMNRVVAIKVLPRTLMHDPTFYERFEREVDVISGLEHPHILPIYDYGKSEDNMPYIVMRYLGGGNMGQMVRRARETPIQQIERPFMQVAQALDYAHLRGIIHRDIKPGNVMLDENGNAYLTDFGIARVFGSSMTGSAIIGTPAYMSPEQANGHKLDARSDIYALGIVLFELLTGREPYQAETPMAVMIKHITEPLPSPRQFRPDIPETVVEVIFGSTAKDPEDRYASAGEMAQAFSEAVRNPNAPAIRPSSGTTRSPNMTERMVESPLSREELDTMPTMAPGKTPPQRVATADQHTVMPQVAEGSTTDLPIVKPREGSSSPMPLIIGMVAVIALVIGGLIFVPPLLNPPAPAEATPAPFRGAETISTDQYTIVMPSAWLPSTEDYYDESNETRLTHAWYPTDRSVEVRLTLADDAVTADLAGAADGYDSGFEDERELIEEVALEDGALRRSFRVENGQIDVFYIQDGARLVTLEIFTTDGTGNEWVDELQLVVRSLRVG